MAIEMAQRAIVEAEAADEKQALAVAFAVLDTSYRWLGETDKAVYAPIARRLYEELGDLSGQATLTGNLGIAAYFEGHWNDAIRLYEESRDLHLKAGNEVQAAIWSANIAEVLINQGKMTAAEALLVEAVPTLAAAGLDSVALRRGPDGTRAGKSWSAHRGDDDDRAGTRSHQGDGSVDHRNRRNGRVGVIPSVCWPARGSHRQTRWHRHTLGGCGGLWGEAPPGAGPGAFCDGT